MKKFLVLFALIAYVMGDKCEDCYKACEKVPLLKRNACRADCILGPCLE